MCLFFFQAEDGIRDGHVTGVQTCALPIYCHARPFDTPLEEGNIIEVICEAEVEYYQASLERPIIIGVGSAEVERATEVAAEAFAAAVAEGKRGNTFGAVDKAERAVLQAAGRNRSPTGPGHGRGRVRQ